MQIREVVKQGEHIVELAKGATLVFLVFILWCISMGWLRWNLWDLAGVAGVAGGAGRDGEDLASAPAWSPFSKRSPSPQFSVVLQRERKAPRSHDL